MKYTPDVVLVTAVHVDHSESKLNVQLYKTSVYTLSYFTPNGAKLHRFTTVFLIFVAMALRNIHNCRGNKLPL